MISVKEVNTLRIAYWMIAESFPKTQIGVFIVVVKASLCDSLEKCLMWNHVSKFWEKIPDVSCD